MSQRDGRIVRQGNENDTVSIFNYVTQDTFDAYMMNIIVTKQRFISQLNTTTARSCEDVDEMVLNYSEIQAMAVGDERIKEKIELDMDVARLKLLESEHFNAQYRLDDTIADAQKTLRNLTHNIEAANDDLAFTRENPLSPDNFHVEIGGRIYTERKEAGEALREAAVKFMADANAPLRVSVGNFGGFDLGIEKQRSGFTVTTMLSIRRTITYTAEMDIAGDIGNITRLENLFRDGVGKKLSRLQEKSERTEADLQAALASKGQPFEHAEELAQKSARLEQLNLELEVGKAEEVIIADEQDAPEQERPERAERSNPAQEVEQNKPATKHKR